MTLHRSWLALLLLAAFAAIASSSPQQRRQLSANDQELYARLLEEQADNTAACNASASSSVLSTYLSALPSVAGLQGCIATNIAQLYPSIAGSGSQCNLTTLSSLVAGDSDDSAAFTQVLNLLAAGVVSSSSSGSGSVDLASALSSWGKDSSSLQGFCNVMNTQAGPCVEALLPELISLLDSDAPCCSELNGYLEVAKLIVPTGQTLEQTLLSVIDGLHRTMCTTTSSDAQLCSVSLSSYLSGVVTSTESSLLGAIVFQAGVPLYAASESDVCSSLETSSLASGLASGKDISYYAASCCASALSSFLESVDALVTHLSGNSMAELFTLITGRQDAATQFASLYSTIPGCSFSSTCTSPSFAISSASSSVGSSSSSAAATSKTLSPENVTCTLVNFCDGDDVCSKVCEAGTALIEPWVARAIAYQRNLSYAETLCYAELPATHNSVITRARGYGNRDQLFNAKLNASNSASYMRTSNQFLSLTDQLDLGVRFLELDVHYFASSLRSAHCSEFGIAFVDDAAAALLSALGSVLDASGEDSTVQWTSALVGCLPSLSGIKADEQRLHNESLAEVATWLSSHPNDLVVIYTEIGDEVASFSQTDALLKLYTTVFGDLLFSPSDLDTAGGDWNSFTLDELIGRGKQVILVATPEANDRMFYMRELCAGWADVPSSTAGSSGTFFGETMNAGSLVRAFKSELHYATLSEDALSGGSVEVDTATEPGHVNASSLPVFVAAGVNVLAPDELDGTVMAALVWSWAEDEPHVDTATAVQLSAADGRWYGVADSASISHVACVSSSNRTTWEVVAQGSSCPDGYAAGAPRLAVENAALRVALQMEASDATAQLDVDLSNFPAISAADQAAYDAGDTSSSQSRVGADGTAGSTVSSSTAVATATWSLAAAAIVLALAIY
ncbi:hypothetical protein PF005_g28618 [Phytophthora fragariae]|uniref:PLC-like phosphodiesterase n=1 Tax=Phytophthora fragariae TaxID=53985 RepID=A0A6A4BEN4_9STRA|nr:hypothetical protein PF003_g20382 [Phytophthora fragariae]KAE8921350.1 hypothetical protein PF009_g28367 [Phytophthora fragariae]KAE8968968.1 hypothetical protein PF011_g26987 [Phytophthora fragariae]KAE9067001.1 hypothetical protein PF010_g27638 [Phytophthora fragariae]KAE9068113.1 hypothetical protein PF007_g27817 [Phytophthora fragariae]